MEINKYIDHTNLKAYATSDDIKKLCKEARDNHFETVCVNPYYVSLAKEELRGSNVGVCTVIGFPLGMNNSMVKEYEAICAVQDGADEIDMVINIGALKDHDYDYVKNEIETVRDAIDGKVLKVIIETCLLTDDEIIKMTEICNETFVNFIKTSTGFDKEGATLHAVKLMAKHKGDVLEIKAAGGIRNTNDAIKFIEAGATRIGTSNGVDIVNGKHECKCGDTCDCGCDEECKCGDDCKCREGGECTCGENCKCHEKEDK